MNRNLVVCKWIVTILITTLVTCEVFCCAYRKQSLNRQLITAIKASNADSVIRLLDLGADANSRDLSPPKGIFQIIKDLLNHGAPARVDADTALLVAVSPEVIHSASPESTQRIITALLHKGANVNASNHNTPGTALNRLFLELSAQRHTEPRVLSY